MKTQSFSLNNKELLLVEQEHPVEHIGDKILHRSNELKSNFSEFKLIGKLPEVTEEQYSKIVAKNYWDIGTGSVYYGASDEEFEEYAKMEEKVFNIDNTFLFEKV